MHDSIHHPRCGHVHTQCSEVVYMTVPYCHSSINSICLNKFLLSSDRASHLKTKCTSSSIPLVYIACKLSPPSAIHSIYSSQLSIQQFLTSVLLASSEPSYFQHLHTLPHTESSSTPSPLSTWSAVLLELFSSPLLASRYSLSTSESPQY